MWEFCTKEEVSGYNGVDVARLEDWWSEVVEDMITEHVGKTFGSVTTYTEDYDGTGTDLLVLDHYPVVSVTSVSVDGTDLGTSEYEVYDRYIRLVSTLGTPIYEAMNAPTARFPIGQNNISITYTAGMSNVPARVKLAAVMMISQILMVRQRSGSEGSLALDLARGPQVGNRDFAIRSGDIGAKLRNIMVNTLGAKWRFD